MVSGQIPPGCAFLFGLEIKDMPKGKALMQSWKIFRFNC